MNCVKGCKGCKYNIKSEKDYDLLHPCNKVVYYHDNHEYFEGCDRCCKCLICEKYVCREFSERHRYADDHPYWFQDLYDFYFNIIHIKLSEDNLKKCETEFESLIDIYEKDLIDFSCSECGHTFSHNFYDDDFIKLFNILRK